MNLYINKTKRKIAPNFCAFSKNLNFNLMLRLQSISGLLLPDKILSRCSFVQCFDTIDDINFGVVTGRDKIQENLGEKFETKKFSPLTKFL